jgi:hypothetical protein
MLNKLIKDQPEGLHTRDKVLSHFEFWPGWLFYIPVYLYVIYLMIRYRGIMLPTAVNPELANGKFIGESKDEILDTIGKYLPEYSARHILIRKNEGADIPSLMMKIEGQLTKGLIHYPFVAKPDLGCRGVGVNLIYNPKELENYIQTFPVNQAFICQELIPYQSEAGIFYCRLPRESRGKIISLTLKFFPFVQGDGIHTLKELIEMDPRASQLTHIYYPRLHSKLDLIPGHGEQIKLVFAGNHSKGAIFKDGRQYITESLVEVFDLISKRLPNFYFGRFDIRYSSLDALERGKEFKIVEINGASSESTHIWDSNYSLVNAYRDLFKQFHLLFTIGAYNRMHGTKTQTLKEFMHSYSLDKKLVNQYPKTH